jgi:uncharacterized protein
MIRTIELVLLPEQAADRESQLRQAAMVLGVEPSRVRIVVKKRSIDARGRQVKFRIAVDAYVDEDPPTPSGFSDLFHFEKDVSNSTPVVVVGCGPAGIFASLRLIELGYRPIVIERGKDVRTRRRDLALMNKQGEVDPDSNYCFGEGGAGTYSDGKLYTRSGKRGDIQRILSLLVLHGADPSILIDAHPHIGTNKLPGIVTALRERIISCGGEVRFQTRLIDIDLENNAVKGVMTQDTLSGQVKSISSSQVILATGHSARDIYELLERKRITIEAKPFALGVRIEHPQTIIDSVQYHCTERGPWLPPASYSLTTQVDGRGVYSFCMCPGGIIAPAATAPGEIVVNGWSPSKRNNPYANSGMVVSVGAEDFLPFGKDALSGLRFQQAVERSAFTAGGGKLRAPAQRLMDFIDKRSSDSLPACSYHPGITSVLLEDVLPKKVTESLRKGLRVFGEKMKPYLTNDAVLVATESRTSSPVRIPRDPGSLQHPMIKGLYPCGEGAGYAGGIVSAAMDGERCAAAAAINR